MLRLPENWNECSTGHCVTKVLGQAFAIGQYTPAARAMAKAAIDFMLAGPRWTNRTRPSRLKTRDDAIQLDHWLFYVLPDTNDEAFRTIKALPKVRGEIDLLVPPWSECLYRHAVKGAYPHRRIDVTGINSFCDTRLFWTGLDIRVLSNQPNYDVGTDFWNRYQSLTQSIPAITIPPLSPRQGANVGRKE